VLVFAHSHAVGLHWTSGVNHGGQGGTVPSKFLIWGGQQCWLPPPKVQALEGHCWVWLREIS